MLIHGCAVAVSLVVITTRFTGSGARPDDRNCRTDRFTDGRGVKPTGGLEPRTLHYEGRSGCLLGSKRAC